MNWWPKQSLGGAVLLVVLPVVFIPLAISNIAVQKAVVSTMVHLPKNGSGDKAFFDFSAINKATRKASLLIKHAQPSANSGSHGQLIPVLASTSPLALEPKRTQPTDLGFAQALEPKSPKERKPLSERHASSGQIVIADSAVAQSTDVPEPSSSPKSPPLAAPPSGVRPTTNQAMAAAQAARSAWAVQVGSFSERTNAISLRDKLRAEGYMALVERADVGGKPVFRVIVGPAFERERAEILQARLRIQEGLQGIVIKTKVPRQELGGRNATPVTVSPTISKPPAAGRVPSPVPSREEPGTDKVTEKVIARALERSLIQQGRVLLPAWNLQVEPGLAYTFQGTDRLAIVGTGRSASVVQQDRRRDTLESSVVLRLGLPWETQAELRIPYFITDEEVTTTGLSEERRDMSGLGDIEVAFSKTLLRERGWIPQTVGTLRWNTGTDGTNSVADDQLSTGAGFNSLQGELTGVKTQDPLVFYGGLFYTSIFSEDQPAGNVDPGDSFGFTLGTILAASPETSLRASLGQSFVKELNLNDRGLAGTDAVGAVLELGLSSLLSQSTLLDLSVGVGLTQDAPDFQIAVSLPIQAGVLPFGQSL